MKKLLILLALLSPMVAVADEPDHRALCNKLKSDITLGYDVYNLVLLDNGSSYISGEGVVLCVYDGFVEKFYGESSVRVMATLNVASNKYNLVF